MGMVEEGQSSCRTEDPVESPQDIPQDTTLGLREDI